MPLNTSFVVGVSEADCCLYMTTTLPSLQEWESAIKNGTLARSNQAVKAVRKAAVSAAAAAAVTAGPPGAVEDGSQHTLSGAQLRALRMGRKLRGAHTRGRGPRPQSALGDDEDDPATAIARAAAAGAAAAAAGTAGRTKRSMDEIMTRDVRDDPFAEL